jgi:hypothetical protein
LSKAFGRSLRLKDFAEAIGPKHLGQIIWAEAFGQKHMNWIIWVEAFGQSIWAKAFGHSIWPRHLAEALGRNQIQPLIFGFGSLSLW